MERYEVYLDGDLGVGLLLPEEEVIYLMHFAECLKQKLIQS